MKNGIGSLIAELASRFSWQVQQNPRAIALQHCLFVAVFIAELAIVLFDNNVLVQIKYSDYIRALHYCRILWVLSWKPLKWVLQAYSLICNASQIRFQRPYGKLLAVTFGKQINTYDINTSLIINTYVSRSLTLAILIYNHSYLFTIYIMTGIYFLPRHESKWSLHVLGYQWTIYCLYV